MVRWQSITYCATEVSQEQKRFLFVDFRVADQQSRQHLLVDCAQHRQQASWPFSSEKTKQF